jgi:hypothetical protein
MGSLALACLLASALLGLVAGDLPEPVPGYALGHPVIWRLECVALLFVLSFGLVNIVALAFHGWLFTSFSTPAGGGDMQKVADDEQTAAGERMRDVVQRLSLTVAEGLLDAGKRLTRLEASQDGAEIKHDDAAEAVHTAGSRTPDQPAETE